VFEIPTTFFLGKPLLFQPQALNGLLQLAVGRLHHCTTCANDGAGPEGSLVLDANGNLYGTASTGGNVNDCYSGCGTVSEITP
jgi:hypothetical protein